MAKLGRKKGKILLVEDNAADIKLIQKVLQDNPLINKLDIVRDGVEAVEFLKRNGKYSQVGKPDLILLDLNLPKKNGFYVLEEIKQDRVLRRIPVVILTISDAQDDLIKAYDLYVNCYVLKPLEVKEFHKIINSIVDFWFKAAITVDET
jgi:two-component system response regulator